MRIRIMLVGVVGLNGSGKNVLADYLVWNYSFVHVDIGQEIRDRLRELGKEISRMEMIELGNSMRKSNGADYWCRKALDSVSSVNVVITSLRNPAEIDAIKERNGIIVEVFADQETRFSRVLSRVKEGKHGSTDFEEFKSMEEREMYNDDPAKQQVAKCIEMADFKIDNNGTMDDFYMKAAEIFNSLGM